ncbi:MAG: long-chain fatty acid--CoA ligase [Chlorobi bacterium]|nr:long-chain fatty acid--CoA ligase [Chlorobiota bacterium]
MNITRTFDLLENYKQNFPKDDVLASKVNGEWKKYSINEYIENANFLSYGFIAYGLKKGDKVITVSNNRPEWNFVDMALSQAGFVHIPVYPTISEEEYKHILKHSDARIVIVSDKNLYQKISMISADIPAIEKVFAFNDVEGAPNWHEILEMGKSNSLKLEPELIKIKESIKPEDLVSIIYTSGTTGVAKGVMLSHKNFVSNFIAAREALPIDNRHKVLSFLPLCHVYERLLTYLFQYKGISIYYAESLGTIASDLKEIKADGFDTVPRLLEKVYDAIMTKGKDLKGIKKALFFWAVNLAEKFEFDYEKRKYYHFKLKIARKLIFSKWQEALGGNIKFIGCGGAAMQERLGRIFWAAGIPVQEGYGLTETSPLIAFNGFGPPNIKIGTVGPAIENVEVKIADDGEIMVKGPNVMMGYYKNPELTKEVFDKEGYFHTGDIGILDEGKFLKITDRKKEIFKTSAGKYVAPQVIENRCKESLFIEQIMVVGENEKFVSALISPNFSFLHSWCARKKIHFEDNKELIKIPRVIKRYQKEIEKINSTLGQIEHIKRFRLVCDEWTPQTGEMSPTLKLKRKVISKKYDTILREIYNYPKDK